MRSSKLLWVESYGHFTGSAYQWIRCKLNSVRFLVFVLFHFPSSSIYLLGIQWIYLAWFCHAFALHSLNFNLDKICLAAEPKRQSSLNASGGHSNLLTLIISLSFAFGALISNTYDLCRECVHLIQLSLFKCRNQNDDWKAEFKFNKAHPPNDIRTDTNKLPSFRSKIQFNVRNEFKYSLWFRSFAWIMNWTL